MTDSQPGAELLSAAERRGNTYKLLAECYHPPDDELGALLDEAQENALDLEVETLEELLPDDLETLRVDHAKLFVGPFEVIAPPYGSVYLEDRGEVMGDTTIEVMAQYREEGLDIGLDEPADHVAAELEFVYYLVAKELEALGESDLEGAVDYLRKQEAFLDAHLGRWITEFAADVEANAETEFYRELARETATFVEDDLDALPDRLERLEDATAGHSSASDADDA